MKRGERLAGLIYGTIVALSVIVASAMAFPTEMGHIAGLVVVTVFVFWLAHVYAYSVGDSLAKQQHLSVREVATIARREASIMYAAAPSVLMLLLGEAGVLSPRVAVWAALGIGLAVLAVQGLLFARMERLGVIATVVVVTVNVSLGALLIALKAAVSYH